jgi:acetylornithine deacetylase
MQSDESVHQKIDRGIEENREKIIRFLQKIVTIPSVTRSEGEGEVQRLVQKELAENRDVKLDIWEPNLSEFQEYPLRPNFLEPVDYKGRPNVIGVWEGKGGGRSLILNGHIDTASPEPINQWKEGPWSGSIKDGKLFGRGAADMKGGVAVIVYVAKILATSGIRLKGNLIIESVAEEEFGGGGALSALLHGYTADAAVVTEPTGARSLCLGWGGSRYFQLKIKGKTSITNRAFEGVNAIELACKCYHALTELGIERLKRIAGKHPIFEKTGDGIFYSGGNAASLAMGLLRAGDWPATIAGWAELMGRVGFPPSESGKEIETQIEECIHRVAKSDHWMSQNPPEVIWYGPQREGDEMSPKEPLVVELARRIQKEMGAAPDLFGSPTTGDITYLAHRVKGYGGIPSVMYGPGGGNAHASDEFVYVDEVIQTLKAITHFVVDWCGIDS